MSFYKNILAIGVVAVCVTGCKGNLFSKHIACDDTEALLLVNQVLKDNLTNQLESELKSLISDGAIKDLDPAKLKLSAQSINFTLMDSRTEFIDPNSSKTNCSIDLATILPSDVVKKSDEARVKVDRYSTESQANDLGVDFDNNKINLTLEYTLQPSDKGDKIFTLVKNTNNFNTLISDTLTYAFLKPQIEKNQIKLKEAETKQAVNAAYEANLAAQDAAAAAAQATVAETEYYSEY
ncbi:hypothetical protein [Acinetobacter sp. YH12128]|uniref:hypothetical protein n=1 Tax=Acinetobacter sp. YH12128 TaxID=2601113 RepID=UPI0015D3DE67|nr:hypothetical protein [Acinetobacter sp. YH12128]